MQELPAPEQGVEDPEDHGDQEVGDGDAPDSPFADP